MPANRPVDPNKLAFQIVGEATGEIEPVDPAEGKDPAAVRVALRRSVDAGEVEKLDNGLYRYRDSGESPEEAALADGGLE
jgi:hypothetical protein